MAIKGFNIKINDKLYYILCDYVHYKTANIGGKNYYAPQLVLIVKNVDTGEYLTGKQLNDTYLEEKISDYIENCLNGQRTLYYDSDKPNENGDVRCE